MGSRMNKHRHVAEIRTKWRVLLASTVISSLKKSTLVLPVIFNLQKSGGDTCGQ